jgi:hypothetical protein
MLQRVLFRSLAPEFDHVCVVEPLSHLLFIVTVFHLLHLVIITLFVPLLHGCTPTSRTEHIPKYSSIEKFITLPFQRVAEHLNRSSNEGIMPI